MKSAALLLTLTTTLFVGGEAWADPDSCRKTFSGVRCDTGSGISVGHHRGGHRGHLHRGDVHARSGRATIRTSRFHRGHRYHGSHRYGRSHGHVTHGCGDRRLACGCVEVYRAGHYTTERVRVQDPGYYEKVWVPAKYETRCVFGVRIKVKVCDGYYKQVYRQGCVRYEDRRVWVPGGYVHGHRCHRHCG